MIYIYGPGEEEFYDKEKVKRVTDKPEATCKENLQVEADGCPACGALPCDWCWNPNTDRDSELVTLRADLARMTERAEQAEARLAVTDEAVERAAIAICDARLWPGAWQKANEVERGAFRFEARAALEAR